MKKLPLILFLVFILAVYGLVSSVLGDLLVGDVQEWLGENFEGEEKKVRWGIAIFTFVTAASVTVYFFLKGKKSDGKKEHSVLLGDDSAFQNAREGQLESFKKRSKNKLAGRDFIDLEVSYTVEGSKELVPILNQGVVDGETEQNIFKVFDGAEGRLLMIGLPGAGKTTLLLQLAIALLDKHEEQIPVVLDIATWQSRFKTIEEWTVELLPDMGFNKHLAKQLIDDKKLLPLFDGLDELAEDSRKGFLKAVEVYATDATNKFVITSRKTEYAATIDAAVEYQVVVNPFTLAQIRKALQEKYSPERAAILEAIDADEHFREAIKTPFYLNAVQLLFSFKNFSRKEAFQANDLKGRQLEIETAFVEHTLGGLENYSKEDGRKWLAFLADRMSRRGLVRFELVDMQYDWGRFGRWGRFFGRLIFVLVNGGPIGLILGMMFFSFFLSGIFPEDFVINHIVRIGNNVLGDYSNRLVNAVWGSSLLTIILTVFYGSLTINRPHFIYTKDKHAVNNKKVVSAFKKSVFLPFSIFFLYSILGWYIDRFFEWLYIATFISIIIFIVVLLMNFFFFDFSSFLNIKKPYQRFYGSLLSLWFSIVQHWHLCYLLRRKGLLPRNYPDFLKAATENNILESDGGSWRFRHRILQEHFVGVWEAEYGDIEELADGYKSEN